MNIHPNITPASPSLASLHFDASFDSIESITTCFAAPVVPTLETTTVTEVALGYHRNGQYSITAMTTSTNAVAERYAYTAYGQPTILNTSGSVLTSSAVGNRYTYTGREWDETLGLHLLRARWMSSLAGRFLGRDPIEYLDKYALYDLEIALSALDPTGNSPSRPRDIDVMYTCLQSNYKQLSLNAGNRPSECPYYPLGFLSQGGFVQLVNDLGVGVILTSVQGILPQGIAGKSPESVLAYVLNQNTFVAVAVVHILSISAVYLGRTTPQASTTNVRIFLLERIKSSDPFPLRDVHDNNNTEFDLHLLAQLIFCTS